MQNNDEEGYSPECIKFLILPEPMSDEMRLHLSGCIGPEDEKAWYAELERLHQKTPHKEAARILARGPRGFQLSEEEKKRQENGEA